MEKEKILMIGMIFLIIISLNFVTGIIWSNGTETEFKITDTSPVCENEEFWVVWDASSGGEIKTSSLDDCFKENGWPSTTCCPEDNECILEAGDADFHKCEGLASPFFCEDYNVERYGSEALAQQYCEGFSEEVAKRSIDKKVGEEDFCGSYDSEYVVGEGTCYWQIYNCRCVWNEDEDVCESQFSKSNRICYGDEFDELGNCTFSVTNVLNDCEDSGFITYTWTARWTGTETKPGEGNWPLECKPGTKKFPCIGITQLTFFTIISLIISIILIIIIYLIISKKKIWKKTGKKSGKKDNVFNRVFKN